MLPSIRNQTPGVHDRYETVENVVWWGSEQWLQGFYSQTITIDGASRDTNHTNNTTILRAGLLMAYHDANQLWLPYNSALGAAVGGTLAGILRFNTPVQIDGTDTNRDAVIFRPGALVKSANLYTNDAGGIAGAKAGLAALGFVLDDWYHNV